MTDAVPTEAPAVDELAWLHAHEYVPWGVHVAAAQEHKQHNHPHIAYGMSGAQAALVNDRFAVILGGRDHPVDHVAYSSRIDVFDLLHDKWLTNFDIKGDLVRRVGHSMTPVGSHRAVVFGGEALLVEQIGSPECLNDCYEISFERSVLHCRLLEAQSESPVPGPSQPPSERAWHSATAVKVAPSPGTEATTDAMLVLGGRDTTGKFLGDAWTLTFERPTVDGVEGVEEFKWTQLTLAGTSPLPLAYHTAVATDNGTQVVILGGRQSARGAMQDGIFVLDIASNAWSQLTTPPANPIHWLARSNATAIEVCVPLDESTGKLAQIFKDAPKDDPHDDPPSKPLPLSSRQILIFGGFTERTPISDPTRLALLDKQTGGIREIHAQNVGLAAYIGQASVASADGKSVYVFGGIHAQSHQYLDSSSAIHFWKPQPGGEECEDENNVPTNGIRTKVYDNGDEYTGEMDPLGLVRHGQGKCVYHNESGVYEGEWLEDVRSGQGVMTYANGDTYAGQWNGGKRHGYGIYETAATTARVSRTEKRYEGMWENDVKTGKGVVTFSDGSKLDGTWENGKLVLQKCTLDNYDDGNGICTYTGEVLDGLPHGQGESRHARETYVGTWLLGKRSGHGVATAFDGTTYTGDWKNGKRNGFGSCSYARTRDKYDGKWVGGVRCGRGLCRYASGAQYDGDWKDDKCHGVGRYTFPDGTFYDGNWKANKFCGDGALFLDLDEPVLLE